jgi:hypothetical protein
MLPSKKAFGISTIHATTRGYTYNITILITCRDSRSHIEELLGLLALDKSTLLLSRRTAGVDPFMAAWLYLDHNHFDPI